MLIVITKLWIILYAPLPEKYFWTALTFDKQPDPVSMNDDDIYHKCQSAFSGTQSCVGEFLAICLALLRFVKDELERYRLPSPYLSHHTNSQKW